MSRSCYLLWTHYVAVRSAKHASSTARSHHALDFERVLHPLPEFNEITIDPFNNIKPIVIITVDGDPDKYPRFAKVIETGIHDFMKNNLDDLFIACNAPGQSAFNRVERRMAPLSTKLAGFILLHEHYGNRFLNSGKTIDFEKEQEHFACAGQTLAEIWSNILIDKQPVVSEYIAPKNSDGKESEIEKE